MHDVSAQTTDQILDQIDRTLGLKLHFPNPFPNELGLPSSRGIVGFRSIHAIYQAWPYLCNGNLCPLSDGAQTFYKDQHHLTPYGALWLQHQAFADLSRFLLGAVQTSGLPHFKQGGQAGEQIPLNADVDQN